MHQLPERTVHPGGDIRYDLSDTTFAVIKNPGPKSTIWKWEIHDQYHSDDPSKTTYGFNFSLEKAENSIMIHWGLGGDQVTSRVQYVIAQGRIDDLNVMRANLRYHYPSVADSILDSILELAIKYIQKTYIQPILIPYKPGPLTACAANRDGECNHPECPQNRDGEPKKSGRHCPLDTDEGF